MRVELRPEARQDLVEASLFYEAQREGLGGYFIDCLFSDLAALESEVGIHVVVYGLHRKLSARFPFAIYYRVESSLIDVIAILDCRRDPQSIEQRLGRSMP